MTPERIAELNLLTIPPALNEVDAERYKKDSKFRDKIKKFNWEFQCTVLRSELRRMYPFTQVNYCRTTNGSLIWCFVLFLNSGNYRMLFYNSTKIELGTIANFIETN